MSSDVPGWVGIGLPVVQMIFFIVTGAAAAASYVLARRTLLQPARTEVFKAQLEQLRIVLKLFTGKSELVLRRECGVDALEAANFARLYDDYARISFGVDIPEEGRPYDRESCPVSRITYAPDELINMPGPRARSAEDDKLERELSWSEYENREIHIPRAQTAFEESLRDLQSEPLLPGHCVRLIGSYLAAIDANVDVVARLVADQACSLPEHFPRLEDMQGASFAWLHNKANHEYVSLRAVADDIASFIRAYLGADTVFEAGAASTGTARVRRQWMRFARFSSRNSGAVRDGRS